MSRDAERAEGWREEAEVTAENPSDADKGSDAWPTAYPPSSTGRKVTPLGLLSICAII